jgi:kinesin family protein 6/9
VAVPPGGPRPNVAPANSRPPPLDVPAAGPGPGSMASPPKRRSPGKLPGPPPPRAAAFEAFRAGPGRVKSAMLADNRAKGKENKRQQKELALAINAFKRDIDGLNGKLAAARAARQARKGDAAQVLDAEEYEALMKLKDLKARYRDRYNDLQLVKSEGDYTAGLVEACARELLLDFDAWHQASYGVPAPGLSEEERRAMGIGGGGGASASATSPRSSLAGSDSVGPPPPAGRPAALGYPGGRPPIGAAKKKVLPSAAPQPPPEDAADPQAAAYYSAQAAMVERLGAAAPHGQHRPGSSKKHRNERHSFGLGHN